VLRVRSGTATPTFESVSFQVPSHSLTIDGLGGVDQINVVNSVNLGSANFLAQAESISVPVGAAITGSGQVSLQALAQNVFSGATSPAAISMNAQVIVEGAIHTTGSLVIDATVDDSVTLNAPGLPSSLSLGATTSASAEIRAKASVSAATMQLTAHTKTNFTTSALNANTGSISVDSHETTHAGIAGGATVSLGGGAISASEPASALVQAIDESNISIDSSSVAAPLDFDFTVLSNSIHLTRDTQAYVTDVAGSSTKALSTAGLAKVDAENLYFREKALWQFGRGERFSDLRRLIRQYGRTESTTFPSGPFHKNGTYGTLVAFPVPDAEGANPAFKGCLDTKA